MAVRLRPTRGDCNEAIHERLLPHRGDGELTARAVGGKIHTRNKGERNGY
jgi:hypothetical protein